MSADVAFPTPLRVSRLRRLLPPDARFARDLRVLGEVPSSSDVLWRLAGAGAPDGSAVCAEAQTAGRGQRGRRWASPAGRGLYASFLLRVLPDPEHRTLLAGTTGIAVARSLEAQGLPARLKWPNDILLGPRKVGGVLIEMRELEGQLAAVIGIGLNVNFTRDDLLGEAPLAAGSLAHAAGRPLDREALFCALARALEEDLARLQAGHADSLESDWSERDALAGAEVTYRRADAPPLTVTLTGSSLRLGPLTEQGPLDEPAHLRLLAVRLAE